MTGRVKDHFWDEINKAAEEDQPEPPDLEMLEMDYQAAKERFERAGATPLEERKMP